jgi:dTDP-4-dehydrorhamnose 3,5-epimerase-like enzyme
MHHGVGLPEWNKAIKIVRHFQKTRTGMNVNVNDHVRLHTNRPGYTISQSHRKGLFVITKNTILNSMMSRQERDVFSSITILSTSSAIMTRAQYRMEVESKRMLNRAHYRIEVESKKRTRKDTIEDIVKDDALFRQMQAEMRERLLCTNGAVWATLHEGMLCKEQAETQHQEEKEQARRKQRTRPDVTRAQHHHHHHLSEDKNLRCLRGNMVTESNTTVAPSPPSLIHNVSDHLEKGREKMKKVLHGFWDAKQATIAMVLETKKSNSMRSLVKSPTDIKKFKEKENIRAMYRRSLVVEEIPSLMAMLGSINHKVAPNKRSRSPGFCSKLMNGLLD